MYERREASIGHTASGKALKRKLKPRWKKDELMASKAGMMDCKARQAHDPIILCFFSYLKMIAHSENNWRGRSTVAWSKVVPALFILNNYDKNPANSRRHDQGQEWVHTGVLAFAKDRFVLDVICDVLQDRFKELDRSGSTEETEDNNSLIDGYIWQVHASVHSAPFLGDVDLAKKMKVTPAEWQKASTFIPSAADHINNNTAFNFLPISEDDLNL